MNSRERLNWLLESGGWNVDDSSAALRELDQLLADCTHYFLGHGLEDQESRLYDRLAQAGYGEEK